MGHCGGPLFGIVNLRHVWHGGHRMLIDIYGAPTSGRQIRRIVFRDGGGDVLPEGDGMTVAHADDSVLADAWICADATGIWLAYNAHLTTPTGYHGNQGHDAPLDSIDQIIFA